MGAVANGTEAQKKAWIALGVFDTWGMETNPNTLADALRDLLRETCDPRVSFGRKG